MVMMVTIVRRSMDKLIHEIYEDNKIPLFLSTLGKGTATSEILDILGLGETEKEIFLSFVPKENAVTIMRKLRRQMLLDVGNGVSFTVPISGIGGNKLWSCLVGAEEHMEVKRNMPKADHTSKYELILAITVRGYTEQVMDAARAAGVTGGTTIHAKGVGAEAVEKFFGISIASEREIVFMVVKDNIKKDVMKNIMIEAGMKTKAKTLVFSLPVTSIAGFTAMGDDMEETEN